MKQVDRFDTFGDNQLTQLVPQPDQLVNKAQHFQHIASMDVHHAAIDLDPVEGQLSQAIQSTMT